MASITLIALNAATSLRLQGAMPAKLVFARAASVNDKRCHHQRILVQRPSRLPRMLLVLYPLDIRHILRIGASGAVRAHRQVTAVTLVCRKESTTSPC